MREIKFRGKAVDTGEWFTSMTISKGTIKRKQYLLFMEIGDDRWKEIERESLGQYISNDRNGKEYYEGDIVKIQDGSINGQPWYRDNLEVKIEKSIVNLPQWCLKEDWDSTHWLEVIGNIHDNPELLEDK